MSGEYVKKPEMKFVIKTIFFKVYHIVKINKINIYSTKEQPCLYFSGRL